jgi:long-chain fatty acid transport protein
MQLAPVWSYAVTERLAIGLGPTVTLGQAIVDPLLITNPDDADRSGGATYPPARGTRYAWGGGAQLGLYYITDSCWHLGASIKSPQWMEHYRVHTENELGYPYTAKFNMDLPMIVSLGAAYSGWQDTVVAVDVRYFDYRNTDGFGATGFGPLGKLNGLGWSNVFAVAAGVQYRLLENLQVRLGYTYNTSPFGNQDTFYNVATPLDYQHQLGVGGSWELSDCVAVHLSYTHYFEFGSSGPIIRPVFGPIPGSTVTNTVSADIGTFGVTVKY